jgi:hypothetical protein
MISVKIFFVILFLFPFPELFCQNYIHVASSSLKTSELILEYHYDSVSNRPTAKFRFNDGFELILNAVCEGEFPWCIRIYENNRIVELGSLNMDLDKGKKNIFIKVRIDTYGKYKKYLDLLPGRYKKM